MRAHHAFVAGCFALSLTVVGCIAGPAPIVIFEDPHESVWLTFDPDAGAGHSHPATLTPEQLTTVLRGIRIKDRDAFGGFGLFGEHDSTPAFSPRAILLLAPHLSQAFSKASPQDMVTFYLLIPDPNRGKLVTSGGMFVRNGRLSIIIANARTSPSSVQYENTYEIDTRAQPLLPIVRYKFAAGFLPKEAWISNAQARAQDGLERYLDESKLLVIDLQRLFAETVPRPTTGKPVPSTHP